MKTLPLKKIKIISPFGMRMHPIEKKMKLHNGVDLYGTTGTPVYAVDAGTVLVSKFVSGAGECIVIKHNGYFSYYCHLSKRNVGTNQIVPAGFNIGAVGNTGASTGAHLHFGLARRFNISNFSSSDWYDPAEELEDLNVKTTDVNVEFNGKKTKLKAIVYNDENYIRVRDIADADKTDDFEVGWNAATKTVVIKTKAGQVK